MGLGAGDDARSPAASAGRPTSDPAPRKPHAARTSAGYPRPVNMSGITAATLLLWAAAAGTLAAATVSPSNPPPIPADLDYRRVVMPDDENAVIDWLKAVPLLQSLEEPARTQVRTAWTPGERPPDTGDWAAVAAWVKQNERALALVEDSLKKRKAQWPVRRMEEFEPGLQIPLWGVRARLAQAYEASRAGDHARAVDLIIGTARLSQMVADGEGALIHYMVGLASRSLAHQAAQRLAAEPGVKAADLRRLLEGLPSLDDEPEVYVRTIRVEFTDYVLRPLDAVRFALDWTDTFRGNRELIFAFIDDDLRRPYVVFLTPSLVSNHPYPLDQAAALRRNITLYERFLHNARASWKDQREDPEDEAGVQAAFLELAEPVLEAVEDEPLPLGREAADRARAAYNAIENPVGRLFEAAPTRVDFSPRRVFQARVEREATRAWIALRLHRLERGHWPGRLQDLVEAGLLPRLPRDAFSGGTLQYDRARLVLWSVGEDGEDDGGQSPPAGRWSQDDAVWQMTPDE